MSGVTTSPCLLSVHVDNVALSDMKVYIEICCFYRILISGTGAYFPNRSGPRPSWPVHPNVSYVEEK